MKAFIIIVLVMFVSCGCLTTAPRAGKSTLNLMHPLFGGIEAGTSAPPGKAVGSQIIIENMEITGDAANIFAAALGGGHAKARESADDTD